MGEDVLWGMAPELRNSSLKAFSLLMYTNRIKLNLIGAHLNLALITCLSNSFGL